MQAVSQQQAQPQPPREVAKRPSFRSRSMERQNTEQIMAVPAVQHANEEKDAPGKEPLSLNTYSTVFI